MLFRELTASALRDPAKSTLRQLQRAHYPQHHEITLFTNIFFPFFLTTLPSAQSSSECPKWLLPLDIQIRRDSAMLYQYKPSTISPLKSQNRNSPICPWETVPSTPSRITPSPMHHMRPPRQPMPYSQKVAGLKKRHFPRLPNLIFPVFFRRHPEKCHACFDGVGRVEGGADHIRFCAGDGLRSGTAAPRTIVAFEEGGAPGNGIEVGEGVGGG